MEYDVVVIGSGGGGMVAALRAHDHGLKVLMVEKAHAYGGTTATSGGVLWMPNHGLTDSSDSQEEVTTYLDGVMRGAVRSDRVGAFTSHCGAAVAYLKEVGLDFQVFQGWPDYFSDKPGAREDRQILPKEINGAELGTDLFYLRSQPLAFKLFNRYTLDLAQAFALSARPKGWQWVAFKMFAKYWLDIRWRLKTSRDRRLTMGNALIGGLRIAMNRRNIPLWLNCDVDALIRNDGRIVGIELQRNGRRHRINAKHGVIVAAGGFEQNQSLRDSHLPIATDAKWSHTPAGANTGSVLQAGIAVGAAVEFMGMCWWAPAMQLASDEVPNHDITHQMFFDFHHPHSVCVNRNSVRFVNECGPYDDFGLAMIEDQRKTGANVPCWMIFDATYRRKYTCGGIMPSGVLPDSKVPPLWWDNYIFRSESIEALAAKIEVDPAALSQTVADMNGYARTGVDLQFQRGERTYDKFTSGDARVSPNSCIGPIDNPPYYAMRVDLGDLGTKGGLKADANGQVVDREDSTIPGLYAIGNAAASVFGDCYPGAGGTIGPAVVFGMLAADDLARKSLAERQPQSAAKAAPAFAK